jgi:hypothetical protein
MNIHHSLIEGWRKCDLRSPPFLFPDDEKYLLGFPYSKTYHSFTEYIASPEFGVSDVNLQLGLLPVPFAGNLENATIFILMLNPGLSPGDYFAEQVKDFRDAHIRSLRQENEKDDYPFIMLNPEFAWHPGFGYWQRKFHNIVGELRKQHKISYQQALSKFSKSLACLELLPYHSKSFGVGSLLNKLPSVKIMRNYVQDVLIPKAMDDKLIIIATRQVKMWQLPAHKNIVIYEGGETRSAHLTITSRGGQAISKHLGLTNLKGG